MLTELEMKKNTQSEISNMILKEFLIQGPVMEAGKNLRPKVESLGQTTNRQLVS